MGFLFLIPNLLCGIKLPQANYFGRIHHHAGKIVILFVNINIAIFTFVSTSFCIYTYIAHLWMEIHHLKNYILEEYEEYLLGKTLVVFSLLYFIAHIPA